MTAPPPSMRRRPTPRIGARAKHGGRDVLMQVEITVTIVALAISSLFAVFAAWWLGIAVLLVVIGAAWAGLIHPRMVSAEQRALRFAGPIRLVGTDGPPVSPAEARLLNLVEGLAPNAGVAKPDCYVADDPSLNALALGRDPRHGVIVVTTGLLGRLSRMELEAVVAHCLVRVRDGFTAGPTTALALAGPGALFRRALRKVPPQPVADLEAVALTRYPPGLVAALRAAGADASAVPAGAAAALESLWMVPTGAVEDVTHRIETLEEL